MYVYSIYIFGEMIERDQQPKIVEVPCPATEIKISGSSKPLIIFGVDESIISDLGINKPSYLAER